MPNSVIPFEPPYAPPYTPHLLPEVQSAIESLLKPGASVFEYGSGHSTLWVANLGVDVVSVEHDEAWHTSVTEELGRADLEAVGHFLESDVLLVDEADLPHYIAAWGQFDMVIVDCLDRCRLDAVIAARPHVKQGGYRVIDDSQWRMLHQVPTLLKGWTSTVYSGDFTRKTGAVRFHETTIYKRPTYV